MLVKKSIAFFITTAVVVSFLAPPSSAFVRTSGSYSSSSQLCETKADLEVLANELNPIVGFYDPLNLAEGEFWDDTQEATIGFLRQAEIKHGRVAMAAFVGYWVQSNYVFGWPQSLSGAMPPGLDLSPEQQWDAIDINAKWQIFALVGFFEIFDECGGAIERENALPHYMRGRKPGQFPSFDRFRSAIHWVPDLYDPFKFNRKMSEEKRSRRLLAEINNGRLAMLGFFGFLVNDKIPGALPAITNIGRPYEGEPMNPFQTEWGTPWMMTTVAATADVAQSAVSAVSE